MSGSELEDFEVTVARAVPVARAAIDDGLTRAMNEYNGGGGSGAGGGAV
jgi:hypothetical protein